MLEPAKRLRLIILDACRDNPFVRTVRRTSETRSIGRGLAKIEVPTSDTLIAFAAKAGSTAADGDGKHSPFTTALLKNLTAPGLDLRIALGRVRDDVLNLTGRKQEPFVYGSLGGTTVTLLPEPKQVVAVPPPAPAAAPTSAPDPNAGARRDYAWAMQVNTKETWDAFLTIHSTGFYADLARGHRAKLAIAADKLATRATPATPSSAPKTSAPPIPPAADAPAAGATPATPAPVPPVVIGLLEPTAPTEPPKAGTDSSETARLMHAELRRLGCYPGAVDASWGSGSRRALELFNKNTGAKVDTRVASLDTLGVLRGKTTRVCPLQCKTGHRAENDACIKIVCRAGFVVGEKGECERKAQPKTASRSDSKETKRAEPRKQTREAAPAQIVCGMTGCFNVGRGCRSEMRGSGRGQVAVVLCDKR